VKRDLRGGKGVVLGLSLSLLVACAHSAPGEIVEARDIDEAESAPVITHVVELGGADVVVPGRVGVGAGDQVAVVGEGLWIQGRAFGRQPTVLIAGLPTFVHARTADGGIVVRVPVGVAIGKQPLQVRTRAGVADIGLNVRRYAAAWNDAGTLQWMAAPSPTSAAVVVASKTQPPSVAKLAFSSDGRAAYALDPLAKHLNVFDVTAQGGPQVAFALELEGTPVLALETAAAAPVLAVVRSEDVLVLETTSAIRPPRSRPRALPQEIVSALQTASTKGFPIAAAVSPDGRYLALTVEGENRVVLLSLTDRDNAKIVASVVVDASVRAPAILDLGFSVEVGTLWALCGPRAAGQSRGPIQTIVVALKLSKDTTGVHVAVGPRTELAAGVPWSLGVSRSRPLPSGASIRRPPQLAQVMVAAAGQGGEANSAQIFAVGADGPSQVSAMVGQVTDLLIEPMGQFALSAAINGEGATILSWMRADGREAESQAINLWPSSAHVKFTSIDVQP
jgi:hypothetical protein